VGDRYLRTFLSTQNPTHYKWEYPNIKVERERRRKEETRSMRMILDKKEALERRVEDFYRKNRRYSPRNMKVEEWGWRSKWELVTFVEYAWYGKNLGEQETKIPL